MSKELSVAPKERINIKFVPATGDQQAEIELPLKMVVLGDFSGKADSTPLEDRRAVSVDKTSFAEVMKKAELSRTIEVEDTLSDDPEASMTVDLSFESLDDFSPDQVVRAVPELNNLVELREALVALKGPLGNMPAFKKAISSLLADEGKREALLSELKAGSDTEEKTEE